MPIHPGVVRQLIYPLYELATGRRVLRKWRELERTQWLPREEILALQWDKLKRLLEHAYANVPLYRRRFNEARVAPADIQAPADMAQISPLTRQDLRQHLEEVVAVDARRGQLQRNATGGSTGEPTVFYSDVVDLDYQSAIVLRNYRWAGLELGEPHVILWGSSFDLSRFSSLVGRLRNRLLNRHMLSAFDLSEEQLAEHVRALRRLQPRVITGYTSALQLLALYLVESGQPFRAGELGSVVSSAETLHPEQRELMQRALGCPVYDRYGSREVGCVAHECEHHCLHVNAESLYVEVIREGRPLAAGEHGEVAVTTLNAYGFPFIRYLIGDAASISDGQCACGRGLPMMDQLLGRIHDILVTADGRFLPGEFFPHLFKEVAGVERFQVVQEEADRLCIRILRNAAYREEDTRFVVDKTRQMIGEQMQIEVEFVEDLPAELSGKRRLTVSHVPAVFSGRAP